jgi:hypothetical protein
LDIIKNKMNNLAEIRDSVIINGFPELMDEEIQVSYEKLIGSWMEPGRLKGRGYYIDVSEDLKESPRRVVEGLFAHEISHVLDIRNFSLKHKLLDRLCRVVSDRYFMLDERNTDIQVIIRGYGNQFLEFLEYAQEQGSEHDELDGLSLLEVRAILKNRTK